MMGNHSKMGTFAVAQFESFEFDSRFEGACEAAL